MDLLASVLNRANALVRLCVAMVSFLYFQNYPLRHSRCFMLRRFIHWFPLGMAFKHIMAGNLFYPSWEPRADDLLGCCHRR